jgi:hypothetical protein
MNQLMVFWVRLLLALLLLLLLHRHRCRPPAGPPGSRKSLPGFL